MGSLEKTVQAGVLTADFGCLRGYSRAEEAESNGIVLEIPRGTMGRKYKAADFGTARESTLPQLELCPT